MSGTEVKKRSCFILNSVTGLASCLYGVLYRKDTQIMSQSNSYSLTSYFYNEDICCKNSSQIADYISGIGSNILQYDLFQAYSYSVNTAVDDRG